LSLSGPVIMTFEASGAGARLETSRDLRVTPGEI